MGTFLGHVFPGTFYIFFGLLWTRCIFKRFFRLRPNTKFQSQATFMPIEGYLKFLFALFGILGETFTGLSSDWTSIEPHNKQHILMYSFFVLNGFFDICVMGKNFDQSQQVHRRELLPTELQRFTLLQALIVEYILFAFHLMGRDELDRHLHVLLLICNAFCIVAVGIDWKYQNHPLAALCKAFCSLFMGTWFIQIAFILHNPFTKEMTWATSGHHAIMNATSLYILHALGNTLIICVFGVFCYRNCRLGYDGIPSNVKNNQNMTDVNQNYNDSEEEYEFNIKVSPALNQVTTKKSGKLGFR